VKFSLAVAATLLAAGMTAAAANEPIKTGYAISKTGPFAPAAYTQINTYGAISDFDGCFQPAPALLLGKNPSIHR
jgi:hypothetical protein